MDLHGLTLRELHRRETACVVQPSSLGERAGLGLFVRSSGEIPPGALLAVMSAGFLADKQGMTPGYCVEVLERVQVSGGNAERRFQKWTRRHSGYSGRGAGGMANTQCRAQLNAETLRVRMKGSGQWAVCLFSTETLTNGQEIFNDYGPSFDSSFVTGTIQALAPLRHVTT